MRPLRDTLPAKLAGRLIGKAAGRLRQAAGADGERGAAVVEILLVMPLMVLLVASTLDAGCYIRYAVEADSAATTAVRYLMDYPDRVPDDEMQCPGGELCSAGYANGSSCAASCGGGAACTCGKTIGNSSSASLDGLLDYLRMTNPALFKSDLGEQGALRVTVDDGQRVYDAYEHKIYLKDGMYNREGSVTTRQGLTVKVEYKTKFPTAVGASLTGDHLLTATAVQHGELDRTGGSTW